MAYVIFFLIVTFLVAYHKLRSSNSDLKHQLDRLEERINLLSSNSETDAKVKPKPKVPETSSPVEEEIFTAAEKKSTASIPTPPPLPPVVAFASTAKSTHPKPALTEPAAAKEESATAPPPTPDAPSFLERI
ncbi:MAG: hypothetical protein GXP30_02165, partial [Verrucomicrobia bacterium]|nr:hypothetical protein [Verrucomicrobiota bacterium]